MIWSLSEELNLIGHCSEVFVYDQEGSKTLLPEFKAAGITTHIHQKEEGFSFSTVITLRSLIKSQKFDAIHSHDLGSLIYTSFANLFLGVRHVHTQHSFIHLKKSWTQAVYERIFCWFPDVIAVVSPHQKQQYLEMGIKSLVITNGIAYPTHNPFVGTLYEYRQTLIQKANFKQPGVFGEIPNVNSTWILVPGRIQKSKGQTKLFDLFAQLKANHIDLQNLHFIIIGAPTFESDRLQLESLFNTHPEFQNSLSYLGFHSNPLDWVIASDGIVLLSEFEGFPLVPLESLGMGIPTLLSRIDAHEFLADQFPLASFSKLDDLSDACIWLLERMNSKNNHFGQNSESHWQSRADFRTRHSIKNMTVDYLKFYSNQNKNQIRED